MYRSLLIVKDQRIVDVLKDAINFPGDGKIASLRFILLGDCVKIRAIVETFNADIGNVCHCKIAMQGRTDLKGLFVAVFGGEGEGKFLGHGETQLQAKPVRPES